MKRQTVPIRSIERYRKNSQGGCDHIKNLKPQGDKWVPIGSKETLQRVGDGQLYHHHVLPDDNYIEVKDGKILRYKYIYIDYPRTPQLISEIASGLGDVNISFVGNMMVVNTEDNVIYYLYKPEDDIYTQLQSLPVMYISRKKDVKVLSKHKQYTDDPTSWEAFWGLVSRALGSDQDGVPHAGIGGLLGEIISELNNEAIDNNFYRGSILITSAFELIDGSELMHNNILSDSLEYKYDVDSDSRGKMIRPRLMRIGSDYYAEGFVCSKLDIRIGIYAPHIDILKDWKGIIRSFNIYAHYIPSINNIVSPQSEWSHKPPSSGHDPEIFTPRKSPATEGFFDNIVFRKVHEISIDDIIDADDHITFTLDLNNYNQKQALGIDNNTHHKLISIGKPVVYNNSLHYPGVKTKFGSGTFNRANFNVDYNTDEIFENYNVNRGYTSRRGGSSFSPRPHGTCWLWQVAEIKTMDGMFYVRNTVNSRIFKDADSDDKFILCDSFVSYPDRRASRIFFVDPNTHKAIGEISLNPHQYINVAYSVLLEDNLPALSRHRYIHMQDIDTDVDFKTVAYDKLLVEKNRLQVSGTNNPLFFPAVTSYSIDQSEEIITCSTVAEELGVGQRGQFPLFLFSDANIYVLQQGQEVLYSQIIPLHRIGIKSDKTVSVSRHVMFQAHDGLYLMDQRGQLTNISLTLEEKPLKINDHDDTDFHAFLDGSILIYDYKHRELIVSNPSLSQSYIYNFDHKAWYMRTEAFRQSLIINTTQRLIRGATMYSQLDSNNVMPAYVQTNKLDLGDFNYKKITRAIVRGELTSDDAIEFTIFCEKNGSYTSKYTSRLENNPSSHKLMISRLAASSKEFVFTIEFDSLKGHVSVFDLTFLDVISNKLR